MVGNQRREGVFITDNPESEIQVVTVHITDLHTSMHFDKAIRVRHWAPISSVDTCQRTVTHLR